MLHQASHALPCSPHPAAVDAVPHMPAALLAAAEMAGVHNLSDFVFVTSLVSGWGCQCMTLLPSGMCL